MEQHCDGLMQVQTCKVIRSVICYYYKTSWTINWKIPSYAMIFIDSPYVEPLLYIIVHKGYYEIIVSLNMHAVNLIYCRRTAE
jgi:hypothetical protein